MAVTPAFENSFNPLAPSTWSVPALLKKFEIRRLLLLASPRVWPISWTTVR